MEIVVDEAKKIGFSTKFKNWLYQIDQEIIEDQSAEYWIQSFVEEMDDSEWQFEDDYGAVMASIYGVDELVCQSIASNISTDELQNQSPKYWLLFYIRGCYHKPTQEFLDAVASVNNKTIGYFNFPDVPSLPFIPCEEGFDQDSMNQDLRQMLLEEVRFDRSEILEVFYHTTDWGCAENIIKMV